MTWVKVDDGFPEHPKALAAGPLGLALWLCGLCYASRQLTDGFIPEGALRRLSDVPQAARHADRLVEVGLWERVEGGWRIHDYDDHQRTREQVETEREAARDRQRRSRERRGVSQRDASVSHSRVTQPETETETDSPPGGAADARTPEQKRAEWIGAYREGFEIEHGHPPPPEWPDTLARKITAAQRKGVDDDEIEGVIGALTRDRDRNDPKNFSYKLNALREERASPRGEVGSLEGYDELARRRAR